MTVRKIKYINIRVEEVVNGYRLDIMTDMTEKKENVTRYADVLRYLLAFVTDEMIVEKKKLEVLE